MRVLLVEDDRLIGDGIVTGLRRLGMTVDWIESGSDALNALNDFPYDAAVLDLGLPGMDGMDVLSYWRKNKNTLPVLILTARDALQNRLSGLNAGADDYLTKPFSLDEVAARLNALVRRAHGFAQSTLDFGALSLDLMAKTATLHDRLLDLSASEFRLLELFLLNKGRVLTRAQIEDKLYGWDQEVESNAIEVHIHYLRKKIGSGVIKTRRNLGYLLGDEP